MNETVVITVIYLINMQEWHHCGVVIDIMLWLPAGWSGFWYGRVVTGMVMWLKAR